MGGERSEVEKHRESLLVILYHNYHLFSVMAVSSSMLVGTVGATRCHYTH